MATQKVKPIFLYAPIQRIDEERRLVEAYAFVNETVEGEGGVRLKRSAMEEATPEYMAWANVRVMHQPVAAGNALNVAWDETGAKMELEVVDDDAWNKVRRGVYKGLSVGVRPKVMRGLEVEKCAWIETSLVDRPADPDAKILAFRVEEPAEEYEVELLEQDDSPQGTQRGTGEGTLDPKSRSDFPLCSPVSSVVNITEVARLETLERLQVMEAELTRVRGALAETEGKLTAAQERVRVLESRPAPTVNPVRFPQALEREFAANLAAPEETQIAGLREEYARLTAERPASTERQQEVMRRIQVVKMSLTRLGATP